MRFGGCVPGGAVGSVDAIAGDEYPAGQEVPWTQGWRVRRRRLVRVLFLVRPKVACLITFRSNIFGCSFGTRIGCCLFSGNNQFYFARSNQ